MNNWSEVLTVAPSCMLRGRKDEKDMKQQHLQYFSMCDIGALTNVCWSQVKAARWGVRSLIAHLSTPACLLWTPPWPLPISVWKNSPRARPWGRRATTRERSPQASSWKPNRPGVSDTTLQLQPDTFPCRLLFIFIWFLLLRCLYLVQMIFSDICLHSLWIHPTTRLQVIVWGVTSNIWVTESKDEAFTSHSATVQSRGCCQTQWSQKWWCDVWGWWLCNTYLKWVELQSHSGSFIVYRTFFCVQYVSWASAQDKLSNVWIHSTQTSGQLLTRAPLDFVSLLLLVHTMHFSMWANSS